MDMQISVVKICTWVNKNHEKKIIEIVFCSLYMYNVSGQRYPHSCHDPAS